MNQYEKLEKKFKTLEKEYEKAEGKPVRQKRLLKQAYSVQKKIRALRETLRQQGVIIPKTREEE